MLTLSVASQKGGCGKTTVSVNLASALAAFNKRVLLIDLDSQGNATNWMNLSEYGDRVFHLLDQDRDVSPMDLIVKSQIEGLDMFPGGVHTSVAERQIMTGDPLGPDHGRLAKVLQQVTGYDYAIIDSPFGLGYMTIQGLVAAQGVIIPSEPETHSLIGAQETMRLVDRIRQRHNAFLELYGIVLMKYDRRLAIQKSLINEAQETWGNLLFRTVVRTDGRVPTATGARLPVDIFAPRAKATQDFYKLAKEVLRGYN